MKKMNLLFSVLLPIVILTYGFTIMKSNSPFLPDEADGFEWDWNHVTLDHDPQAGVSSGDYYFTVIGGHSVVVLDLDSPAGDPDGTWSANGVEYTFNPNLSYPAGDGHWQIGTHGGHDVIILDFN